MTPPPRTVRERVATRLQMGRSRALGIIARPRPGDHELVKLGSDYGGWVVPADLLPPGSICYTAGVGEDTTFDAELVALGCRVHAIDPTPRAIAHVAAQDLGDRFQFHPIGLWSEPAELRFYAPKDPLHVSHSIVNLQKTADFFVASATTVAALMERLGHHSIDLLKLDIEGAQFAVLRRVRQDGIRPTVICVEFDQPASATRMIGELLALRRYGYEVVARDGWNLTLVALERT